MTSPVLETNEFMCEPSILNNCFTLLRAFPTPTAQRPSQFYHTSHISLHTNLGQSDSTKQFVSPK